MGAAISRADVRSVSVVAKPAGEEPTMVRAVFVLRWPLVLWAAAVMALPLMSTAAFWHLDNFPMLAQAQTAAGPTYLAADLAGKAWLFTSGPPGGSSPGGGKVAEIGPVPPISAPEYLLRINGAVGLPGVKTPVPAET